MIAFVVGVVGPASTPSRTLAQATTTPSEPASAVCTPEVREAASVRFAATGETLAELARTLRVAPGPQRFVADFVQAIRVQIDEGARDVRVLVDELAGVAALGCPEWTIAARARQGEAYELFARAIADATLTPLPAALQPRMRGSSPLSPLARLMMAPDTLFVDQVRQVLEEQIRPVECFAVVSYLRAVRLAIVHGIDDEHARAARARLWHFADDRIVACVADDRSLAPYTRGELGTPRGQWQAMTPGVAPPPLAQ